MSLLASLSCAVWKYSESHQSGVSVTYSCCIFLPSEQLIMDLAMSWWLIRCYFGVVGGFFVCFLFVWGFGVFFFTQDLTAFMVLWHLWPLFFLCCSQLPSDFCRSSRRVMLSTESCHEFLALWFGLKVGHKICPSTHTQQFSRGGEKILAFVLLMVSLILSGFPGLRGQNRKRTSRMNLVLLSCEFVTGV